MNYPRKRLSALLTGAVVLLTGCGTTHIVDTSPQYGSPRIVASDVKVKVTPYVDATAPGGGRVEEQNILGNVVMTRDQYADLLTARKDNKLLGIYADECVKDALCSAAAGRRAEALR